MGYIYIAWDRSKPELSKVGMTEQTPEKRISQTENPDYELYKAYKLERLDVRLVEKNIHEQLAKLCIRRKHKSTSRNSEWFECPPSKALEIVSDYLLAELSASTHNSSNTLNIQVTPVTEHTEQTLVSNWLPSPPFEKKESTSFHMSEEGTNTFNEKLANRPKDIEDLQLKRHFNRKFIIPQSAMFSVCNICQSKQTSQVILGEYLCSSCLYLKYPELKGITIVL